MIRKVQLSARARIAHLYALSAAACCYASAQPAVDVGAGESDAPGFVERYTRYAVAADHPLASEAGAEMLAKGGNAVDAAVAASFTLSVVRPFSCGIGGGGFMALSLPGKKDGERIELALNYREVAPSGAGKHVYERVENERASLDGGMACAVPGTVAGLLHALETYGTLDRATVLEPAIRAAREGFVVDKAYEGAAIRVTERFVLNPAYKERFAFTWERLLGSGSIKVGDVIRNPEQGAVLEAIARDGANAFYSGEIARTMREAVNADARLSGHAGARDWFGEKDFALFKIEDAQPLKIEFLGRKILLMPPPSSGGIAMAQTLGIAERRELAKLWSEGNAGLYAHVLAESFKFAFADRANYLADPAFVPVPVAKLMGDARLDDFASRLDLMRAYGPDYYGEPGQIKDDGGTSHVSVIDASGGAVAITETINTEFGSLLAPPGLGFCLNNEMDDFTTRREKANVFGLRQSVKNLPEPGKRPLSSMSPTIVVGASGPEIVAGASGGPRIITATTQAVLNVMVRGMGAGDAVAARRMHHQWLPAQLEIERGFDEREVMRGLGVSMWLRKLHHDVKETDRGAVVQMVVRRGDGALEAASDPRKGGRPAGK